MRKIRVFQTQHDQYQEYNNSLVRVRRELTEEEVDEDEVGKMYEVELINDNILFHVFEDELVERYWSTSVDNISELDGWFGVVDELKGGIIAYFPTEEASDDYILTVDKET